MYKTIFHPLSFAFTSDRDMFVICGKIGMLPTTH